MVFLDITISIRDYGFLYGNVYWISGNKKLDFRRVQKMRFTIYEGDIIEMRFINRKGISATAKLSVMADNFYISYSENINLEEIGMQ